MFKEFRTTLGSTLSLVALFTLVSGAQAQTADDASASCLEASRMIEEGDYVAALEEAKWCVESLEQMKIERILTVFPDDIDGYVGGELLNNSAMGVSMMERSYTRENDTVDVALTSGIAGGGGFAALAHLGMGVGGVGNKIRVQKRTVIDMSEVTDESRFLVQLKSNQGILTISSSSASSENVLKFIRAFPIKELDEALEP